MKNSKGNLLVVDDNEMNRDLLTRRLVKEGHTVTIAKNGREAVDLVQSSPFDLILLDIMMPEMNGYEVLERLKDDENLRHIPVIMISALDEIDSVVRCIEMGADDYLPKPFNPVLLRARIGASLEKKRLRDREVAYRQQIEAEKRRADDLLHVIFPRNVVQELKDTNEVKPRRYDNVAVLFCDIIGFTAYCDRQQPEVVVPHLQEMVEIFEEVAERHGLQKIKTIGDAFMAASGILTQVENPALDCIRCGLDMVESTGRFSSGWLVRVGIHTGPVIAGVIGRKQYLFDIWGDTVNTASRIERYGQPNLVCISDATRQKAGDACTYESIGFVLAKGKGEIEIFRIVKCLDLQARKK